MPRESHQGTGFRKSQARAVLLAIIRTIAPRMVGRGSLREVMKDLAGDNQLWRDLEEQRKGLVVRGTATMPEPHHALRVP